MLLAAELALPPRPALVVLIRHGHKDAPGGSDHSGTANYNLSSIGLAQAQRLAAVVPTCLQESRPLHLISHGFHPDSGKNARSYQTLVPLAISSGVNIRMLPEAEADSRGSGNRLLADPQYGGGVMVIAWGPSPKAAPEVTHRLCWVFTTPERAQSSLARACWENRRTTGEARPGS